MAVAGGLPGADLEVVGEHLGRLLHAALDLPPQLLDPLLLACSRPSSQLVRAMTTFDDAIRAGSMPAACHSPVKPLMVSGTDQKSLSIT